MPGYIPADDTGGTCTDIIDLSRPTHGGLDPDTPLNVTAWEVSGFAARAHTWSLSDDDAPIYVEPGMATSDGVLEGRCPGCLARPTISRMDRSPLLLILEHEPGCEGLSAFAAKAPG